MNESFLKKPWFWLQLSVLLFLSACNSPKNHFTKKTSKPTSVEPQIKDPNFVKKEQPILTIWVHGTRAISKTIFPHFFRTIDGMHHASSYNHKNNLLRVAQTLHSSDPKTFNFENIYVFGWDGRLNQKRRKNAARKLYKQLLDLIEKIKQKYKSMSLFYSHVRCKRKQVI